MQQSQAQMAQALSRVPLFSTLASDSLMVLAQACQLRSYQPGEALFQQGEMTRGLQLILAGQARLVQNLPNGIQAVRAQLGPGQFINEGALQSEGYQTSSLVAFQPTLAALLTREASTTSSPIIPPSTQLCRPEVACTSAPGNLRASARTKLSC